MKTHDIKISEHTIKAMTDLLFEVYETKERLEEINSTLGQMNRGDDFTTYIAPMGGRIESFLSDALDLFFEEITDCESIANQFLYENGIVSADGIEFRLHNRAEFNNFIAYQMQKKAENDENERRAADRQRTDALREAAWLALEELTQWQGMDEDDAGTKEAIAQLRETLGAKE